MSEKTRVLVTGGAGYIGSTLVPALLGAGYNVRVVDNLVFNQASLLTSCLNPDFSFVRGNVCDTALMDEEISRADVVIPLAALVGAPACDQDPETARMVNIEAHRHIAKSVSASQLVIFPVTNSGYGIGEAGAFCTEDSPLRPVSSYGRAKVEIEAAFLERGNAITLRLATVFGASPRMRMDLLVNDFVFRAFKDRFIVLFEEHFRRNFLHVRDAAGAFLFSMENAGKMRGEPYNAGLSDANLTKRELCEKIREHCQELAILSAKVGKDPDRRDYYVSNEKIEALGFRPKVSLDEGIRELLMAYRMLKPNIYANV